MNMDRRNIYLEFINYMNERTESYTCKDEGKCLWIEIKRNDDNYIGVEISDELTLFWGNCHEHFSFDDDEIYGKSAFLRKLVA